MYIDGIYIPVDVRAELEAFEWLDATWTRDKLVARSPFRTESRPSFYVWLQDNPRFRAYAGQWGDQGGSEYVRGSFLTLLAYLRQESEDETKDYLLAKYAPDLSSGDFRQAHALISQMFANQKTAASPTRRKPLDKAVLNEYAFRHPYLEGRGISEQVQRAMKIGYDREKKMVTIPWFNQRGELVQIKKRSVTSKFFRYLKLDEGGWPVRELLYGIDIIHRKNLDYAVICEAEIDALYAMTAGIPAIAVGGSKFSEKKRDLILRSPLRRLIIAADNDKAGRALEAQIIRALSGRVDLWKVRIPERYKDLNDIKDVAELKNILKNPERVRYDII